MRAIILAAVALAPLAVSADTLVASQTIRAKTLLGAHDVALVAGDVPGALSDPAEIVGQEARVTLFAGRPIRPGDVGPPALIERNQIVPLVFATAALTITAEARALDRAGIGDRVRAMNLSSRTTVFGTVSDTGAIIVSGGYR